MRPHLTLLTPGSWSHQTEAGEVDVAEAGAGHEARIAHQLGEEMVTGHFSCTIIFCIILALAQKDCRRIDLNYAKICLGCAISSFQVLGGWVKSEI